MIKIMHVNLLSNDTLFNLLSLIKVHILVIIYLKGVLGWGALAKILETTCDKKLQVLRRKS